MSNNDSRSTVTKSKAMRTFAAATLSACVVIVANAQAATCNKNQNSPGVTKNEIILGATMPLTGSGAETGQGVAKGQKAYYAMVNANGGVKGHKIKFHALDDQYKPSVAQQQMRSLIQRYQIFAVSGDEGTPNFLAEVPLIERSKVPAIAPYAPSSKLGTMKTPHIYMAGVNYITEFRILTAYVVKHYHPKKLGLVGVQGNVLQDAKKGMEQGLKGGNAKLQSIPEVPGTPNLTPIATQLKKAGDQWVFLILTNNDTGQLLKAMHGIGYKPHTAAWSGMDDMPYIKAFGNVSQGMIVAEETASLRSDDPLVKKFIQQFKKQTGDMPSKFEELGWVQAEITTHALKEAPALTRSCLLYALDHTQGYKTGILPPISWGPKTRQGVNAIGLVRIKGDKAVEIAPFHSVPK